MRLANKNRALRVASIGLLLILAIVTGCRKKPATPHVAAAQEFDRLFLDCQEELDAAFSEMADAQNDSQMIRISKKINDICESCANKYFALAESTDSETVAAKCLVEVTHLRPAQPIAKKAIDLLMGKYILSPHIDSESISQALQFPDGIANIERLIELNRNRKVVVAAKLHLARRIQELDNTRQELADSTPENQQPLAEINQLLGNSTTDDIKKRLMTLLADIKTDDGGATDENGRRIGEIASDRLFAIEHVQLNQAAPEIVGKDIDGEPLRLSQFRGKIVVLTFWGTWCGPCRTLVEFEKKIAEKYSPQDVAIVGVSSDEKREQLQEYVQRRNIHWPNFWDQSPTGPIARQWKVDGWPTVVIIDAEGVIRYRDVARADVERAIKRLIEKSNSK